MEIRIEAARGEDRFSMSHGSFRYRRKTGRKRRLSIEEAGLLVERLREEGQGNSDNLGYRLVREELPLFIAENVAVEWPSDGWIRISGTEYLFPEDIREVVLTGRDSVNPIKD